MEDEDKVHIPNTLEDSKFESDSFREWLKLIEGMGVLGQSSSKQGQKYNPISYGLWIQILPSKGSKMYFIARTQQISVSSDQRCISQQEHNKYLWAPIS